MSTGSWAIIAAVVITALVAVWIGNTIRWTRANDNLARKSPKMIGDDGPTEDRTEDGGASRGRRRGAAGQRFVLAVVLGGAAIVAVTWIVLYNVAA